MSKVATVWQFSLPCIMSKKCLLMKRAHFVGIICCWQWQYLNWQTGPLPKAMLLFFSSFFIFKLLFKRHEGNISSFNCFIIIIIIFSIVILSQEFGTLISMISSFSPSASEIHFQKKFPGANLPFIPRNIIISWVRSVSINTCNW